MNTRLQRVCFVDVSGKRDFGVWVYDGSSYVETGWMFSYAVFYDIENLYWSECSIDFVILRRAAYIKTDIMIDGFMPVFTESPGWRIYEVFGIVGWKDSRWIVVFRKVVLDVGNGNLIRRIGIGKAISRYRLRRGVTGYLYTCIGYVYKAECLEGAIKESSCYRLSFHGRSVFGLIFRTKLM